MSTSILHAIAKGIYGKELAGPSWASWRTFLKTLHALPLTAGELDLMQRCTGLTEPPSRPYSECCIISGRRSGKTRVLGLLGAHLALFGGFPAHLAPGEKATIACIGRDTRQGQQILAYVSGFLKGSPTTAKLITGETVVSLTVGRVEFLVLPASHRAARGHTLAAALCDEAAFWPDEDASSPAAEIVAALRPALSTLPGSMLVMASSPFMQSGLLWDLHSEHFGRADAPCLIWKSPSLLMNPSLNREMVERELAADRDRAGAEWNAEFRRDVGAFLSREVIDAAVERGRAVRAPLPGTKYCAFVDPSGAVTDSFVCAVAHREDGQLFLDAIHEARPPFLMDQVVQDIAALVRLYHLDVVSGDRFAGQTVSMLFQKSGIRYTPTRWSSEQVYVGALPLLAAGKVNLLDHERLISQLRSLCRRVVNGRERIGAPHGQNDDVALAALGAVGLAAMQLDPAMKFVPPSPRQYDRAPDFFGALGGTTPQWLDRRPPDVMNSVAPADLARIFDPKTKH